MRFLNVFLAVAALTIPVPARMHTKAVCSNADTIFGWYTVPNANATRDACDAYKKRVRSPENYDKWEDCADCNFIDGVPPFCESPAEHIGGNEWKEYCVEAGATDSQGDNSGL